MKKARAILISTIAIVGLSMASCGPSDFDPENLINTVRVMASSADEPYAKPGDTVNLQVLAYDGRLEKPAPMKIYWLPITCENPVGDAYYGCFASIATRGSSDAGTSSAPSDAGAAGNLGSLLQPGADITNFLPVGPDYSVKVPADAVSAHPVVQGASAPYGLVIVFNVACAGRVKLLTVDPSQPQSVPVGCFDDVGNQLTADDFVFGYTRVYAYEADSGVTNTNPVLSDVRVGGNVIDPHVGFTVKHGDPKIDVDVDVPASSQELTADKDSNGAPLKETIYAAYFVSVGKIDDQVRVLYDAVQGAVTGTNTKFEPPADPGDGFVWIVVHDNRDGAAWVQVPIHVN